MNNLALQSNDMKENTKNQYNILKTVLKDELTEEEHEMIDANADNPHVIYIKFTEAGESYQQKKKLKDDEQRLLTNIAIEERAKKEYNNTVKRIFVYVGAFIGSTMLIFSSLSLIIYILMELLANEQVDLLVIIGAAGVGTFFILKWLIPIILVVLAIAKVKAWRFKAKQLVDDTTSKRSINRDGLRSIFMKDGR